jgi:YggT family protein
MLELILNYTLAFIMWLVIARAIMSLFTTDMNNFIYAMLYKSTEPLYRVARKVFPKGTTFFILIIIIILRIIIIKLL